MKRAYQIGISVLTTVLLTTVAPNANATNTGVASSTRICSARLTNAADPGDWYCRLAAGWEVYAMSVFLQEEYDLGNAQGAYNECRVNAGRDGLDPDVVCAALREIAEQAKREWETAFSLLFAASFFVIVGCDFWNQFPWWIEVMAGPMS